MYTTFYETKSGKHVMIKASTLAATAGKLERLWKARIEAEAFDDYGNVVGAVYKRHDDNKLTWFCEV